MNSVSELSVNEISECLFWSEEDDLEAFLSLKELHEAAAKWLEDQGVVNLSAVKILLDGSGTDSDTRALRQYLQSVLADFQQCDGDIARWNHEEARSYVGIDLPLYEQFVLWYFEEQNAS